MTALERIEEKTLQGLEKWLRDVAKEYRKAGRKAVEKDHPVEAAMCDHLAKQLNKPLASLEEVKVSRLFSECQELSSFLPVPERTRKLGRIERQGQLVSRIRSLKLGMKDEDHQIRSATQKPGRPPEAREVAVRAMELHMKGHPWSYIEGQLLPHRRHVRNPGMSIRREVQLLRSALRRYCIRVEKV